MAEFRLFSMTISIAILFFFMATLIVEIFDIQTPAKKKASRIDTLYNQCIADGVKEYECYGLIYKRR